MQESSMELFRRSSHIAGGNATYVEDLYERYLLDPNSVPEQWRDYFDKLPRVETLGLVEREHVADLELSFHELSAADLDTVFQVGSLRIGHEAATLSEIIDALEATYCRSVGAEFMHIVDTEQRQWIMSRMESVRSAPDYGPDVQRQILRRLIRSLPIETPLRTAALYSLPGLPEPLPRFSAVRSMVITLSVAPVLPGARPASISPIPPSATTRRKMLVLVLSQLVMSIC